MVFLEPGEERAQKIAKAMGSQTASDILQVLGENPKSLTDITEMLSIPMNTVKYHVENLLDAGLISVSQTKYSVKGREVKMYVLTNQLLIVAPRHSAMRSLILKYASLFGIVAFGSVIISLLSPFIGEGMPASHGLDEASLLAARESGGAYAAKAAAEIANNASSAPGSIVSGAKGIANVAVANLTPVPNVTACLQQPAPIAIVAANPPLLDPALAFFLGGLLVIVLLLCHEAWTRKKEGKKE